GMAALSQERIARLGLPDVDASIGTGGGDILAIGRPGSCLYIIVVFAIHERVLASQRIPHLHRVIDISVHRVATGRGNTPVAMGRCRPPCNGIDRATVSLVGEKLTPRRGLAYLHSRIPRTGSDI